MTRRALDGAVSDCPARARRDPRRLRADRLSGVTGVIASVVTLLTGATHDTGFKGLAGQFDRRKLMYFLADIGDEMRFTRTDTAPRSMSAPTCSGMFPSRRGRRP
jgi:hypothetical protein